VLIVGLRKRRLSNVHNGLVRLKQARTPHPLQTAASFQPRFGMVTRLSNHMIYVPASRVSNSPKRVQTIRSTIDFLRSRVHSACSL
jgi:hypothetical protein